MHKILVGMILGALFLVLAIAMLFTQGCKSTNTIDKGVIVGTNPCERPICCMFPNLPGC